MIYLQTDLIYYQDGYKTSLTTEIQRVIQNGDKLIVFLDATIFYPFGGGQPSDQGLIATQNGKANVIDVQMRDGIVEHTCTLIEGSVEEGEEATLTLDWNRRHFNMRVHSAGHLIHDVLMQMVDGLTPGHGNHGSKPFLEYSPEVANLPSKEALQEAVNKIIQEGRKIITRETSYDELRQLAKFIPPNLPRNKPLRIIQIDGFHAMPDGGTQVRDAKEIGRVEITSVNSSNGKVTIKYRVYDAN